MKNEKPRRNNNSNNRNWEEEEKDDDYKISKKSKSIVDLDTGKTKKDNKKITSSKIEEKTPTKKEKITEAVPVNSKEKGAKVIEKNMNTNNNTNASSSTTNKGTDGKGKTENKKEKGDIQSKVESTVLKLERTFIGTSFSPTILTAVSDRMGFMNNNNIDNNNNNNNNNNSNSNSNSNNSNHNSNNNNNNNNNSYKGVLKQSSRNLLAPPSFQQSLQMLVQRLCTDHPHHTLPLLFALANESTYGYSF